MIPELSLPYPCQVITTSTDNFRDEGTPGIRNDKGNELNVGTCLACLRNNKGASVTGLECVRDRINKREGQRGHQQGISRYVRSVELEIEGEGLGK